MTPDPLDDPDFTAYALGEATLEQTTKVRQHLAAHPQARQEFEQLQVTISALQQSPPAPSLALHPRQRETVLAMGQIKSLPPATLHPLHRPKANHSQLWTLSKYAAAAAVAAGAFIVGQHVSISPSSSSTTIAQHPNIPSDSNDLSRDSDFINTFPIAGLEQRQAPSGSRSSSTTPLVSQTGLLPEAKFQYPDLIALPDAVALTTSPLSNTKIGDDGAMPTSVISSNSVSMKEDAANRTAGFVLTSKSPTAQFEFKPNQVRHHPQEFAGVILSSSTPVFKPSFSSAKTNAIKHKGPQPPLIVRSWKAEIASCPWDANRRLMRLVAQIPLDQPAVEFNEANYRIQAKFDPKQVQAHRLVAEKHLRPANGRYQATRIVWYELILQPGTQMSAEAPITLGQLKIVQPKTKTSDANQLRVTLPNSDKEFPLVDRGTSFDDAREDFMFETAMVGFGLLLKGQENIGTLNHDLVLRIAERSSNEPPEGERAKFIESVRQAKSAAGL